MRGHTLIELLLVLTLLGATTASLAPTVRRYGDRASVVAAREALVGVIAQARQAAMVAGESRVRIASGPWTARASVADSTLRVVDLEGEYAVTLALNEGRSEAELEFNALGLGRLAGQTIRFRRGDAVTELIVSGYGRVRRR